jgi:hypothetical protein
VAASQIHRGSEYKEKYNDVFHEARCSMASAWYQQAMLRTGAERDKLLQRAKATITSTHTLYPDMGGTKWRPQYDRLLKRIEKELGQPARGLPSRPAAEKKDGS